MLQIYFFSSVFLIINGIVLSHQKFGDLLKYNVIFNEKIFENKKFNVVIALLTIVFGVLLILKPYKMVIVGDIIPALLGIIGGVALILQSFDKKYSGNNKFLRWTVEFIKSNIAMMGIAMIVLGILHAIFPEVILL